MLFLHENNILYNNYQNCHSISSIFNSIEIIAYKNLQHDYINVVLIALNTGEEENF